MAKSYIISKFGDKYFENCIYKNKDGSKDAHEAIRPADINKSINGLSEDEKKSLEFNLKLFYSVFYSVSDVFRHVRPDGYYG
jgi:DNA topoisomerase IA